MNLIRLLVIGLIIYLVLRIFKRWAANKNQKKQTKVEHIKMVRCKVCQLHLPENDALQKNGDFYCSQEHLENKNH